MPRDDRKSRKGSSLFSWLLWIVAFVVLVIIFFSNRNKIASNLKTTGFFEKIFGTTPAFIANAKVDDEKNSNKKNDVEPFDSSVEFDLVDNRKYNLYDDYEDKFTYTPSHSSVKDEKNEVPLIDSVDLVESIGVQESHGASGTGVSEDVALGVYAEDRSDVTTVTQVPVTNSNPGVNPNLIYEPNTTGPVKTPTETPAETVSLRLFFIEVNQDGTSSLKELTRKMKKTSSPLTDSIEALIDGPTPSEEKSYKCRTMVSPGTRLISASVSKGVATLNFSEEFEFNNFGIEGVMWELEQIVYTATAFPTVEKVQILIEGVHREYISDGLKIGEPLSRGNL